MVKSRTLQKESNIKPSKYSGQFVNRSGQFVKHSGQFVNHSGQFVNHSGQFVNQSGQFVNHSGQFVNQPGSTLGTAFFPHPNCVFIRSVSCVLCEVRTVTLFIM